LGEWIRSELKYNSADFFLQKLGGPAFRGRRVKELILAGPWKKRAEIRRNAPLKETKDGGRGGQDLIERRGTGERLGE